MEIAIISDTHMPRGARRLPDACVERLRAAAAVIHAGDLLTLSVLAELRAFGEVFAVHGNADDAEVRAALPATRTVEFEGAVIGVIHDAGRRTVACTGCGSSFRRLTRLCSVIPICRSMSRL